MRKAIGSYTTPKEIINFCVNFLKPSPEQLVLDPACGTGGFLKGVNEYFIKNAKFNSNKIFGIEIEQELCSLIKKEDSEFSKDINVINADSLSSFEELSNKNPILKPETFDLILTSPPFGRSENLLEKSSLPRNSLMEILFLERSLEFLKFGGKMSIILPNFILKEHRFDIVRKFIFKEANILAVISLPQFAFVNFGTKIKTNILFLEKRNPLSVENGNDTIFMAIADNIGIDGKGRKDNVNDFSLILNEYRRFSKNRDNYPGYTEGEVYYG